MKKLTRWLRRLFKRRWDSEELIRSSIENMKIEQELNEKYDRIFGPKP